MSLPSPPRLTQRAGQPSSFARLQRWLKPERTGYLAVLSLLQAVELSPPVSGAADAEQVRLASVAHPPRSPRTHVVRPAENLSAIALRYEVSVGQLRRWNDLLSDRLVVGQKLSLWPGAPASYRVRRGDTISEIAVRFGVSATTIKRLNKLTSDRIRIDDTLTLRATPAPSKKRSAPTAVDGQLYIVRRGDTLSEISAAHHLSLSNLRQLNGLSGDRIRPGQKLILRAAPPASTAQRAKNDDESEVYVVRSGDTLSEIAIHFDVGLVLLRQLNGLRGDFIKPGQKLKLRPTRRDEGIHIVRRGDTLSGIALSYSIDLDELRRLNGIDDDRILVGQKLRLKTRPTAAHIVERGDALWEIARAYGMKVTAIKELNGLRSDRIYPGQELKLNPQKAKRLSAYTVLRGDNLSEIARLHQMSVAELKKVNRLESSVIHPGQELKVRPLLGAPTRWLEVSEIRWSDLQVKPSGVKEISLDNGPYYGQRPKAERQRAAAYFEGHPASPLKTYRQARQLWAGFEHAVAGMGQLSDQLKGWHIVLDPGHGGLDPGAIVPSHDGNGRKLFVVEDEYVYDIAMRAYVLMRLHGAHVEMTLLSPNHLIRQNSPPALTFVHEKNEVYNSHRRNKRNRRGDWPSGSRDGLDARVEIARQTFSGTPESRRIFISLHADRDERSAEAPLVLYYESRNGKRRDLRSKAFARALVPALGAGTRIRGQGLRVLRDNPAAVKVLVELRNLAYVDHAWALRFEQLRHRDAEKLVKGVLDYVAHSQVSARR